MMGRPIGEFTWRLLERVPETREFRAGDVTNTPRKRLPTVTALKILAKHGYLKAFNRKSPNGAPQLFYRRSTKVNRPPPELSEFKQCPWLNLVIETLPPLAAGAKHVLSDVSPDGWAATDEEIA